MIKRQWKLAFLLGVRNHVKNKIRNKTQKMRMKRNYLSHTWMHCFKYINVTQLHSQLFMLMGGWHNLNKAKPQLI